MKPGKAGRALAARIPPLRVKQSQFGSLAAVRGTIMQTNPIWRGRMCRTKPIRTGIGVRRSGVSDLGPDAAPLSPGLSCETNPISVGAKSKLSRLQKKSCVVFGRLIGSKKTKPISGVSAGRFLPRPSSLRPPRWWLYKQTQFRPYADPEIGVPGRADRAKQSQFEHGSGVRGQGSAD